jgi:hypothetical protein
VIKESGVDRVKEINCEWCGNRNVVNVIESELICSTCNKYALVEKTKRATMILQAKKNYEYQLECELTPSLQVKYDPGAVLNKEEDIAKRNFLRLIKKSNIEAHKEMSRWFNNINSD